MLWLVGHVKRFGAGDLHSSSDSLVGIAMVKFTDGHSSNKFWAAAVGDG